MDQINVAQSPVKVSGDKDYKTMTKHTITFLMTEQ